MSLVIVEPLQQGVLLLLGALSYTAQELAQYMGEPEASVEDALNKLKSMGCVTRTDGKKWTITHEGESATFEGQFEGLDPDEENPDDW